MHDYDYIETYLRRLMRPACQVFVWIPLLCFRCFFFNEG